MRLFFAPKKLTALVVFVLFFLPVAVPAAGLLESAGMETKKIELIAGKSLVMKLGVPIKKKIRVSIGSPEIMDCLVLPPDEIYLKGISAGVTNLILWQEDQLLAIYDVEVSYDVSRLKEKLYQVLPDEPDIQVFSANDTITLLGKVSNNANLSRALVLAASYAPEGKVNNLMEVGGTHQVMLEVTVAEMSRSLGKDLGIDVSFFNDSGDLGAIILNQLGDNTPLVTGTISSAVNSFFSFSSGSATWTGFIQALQEDGLVKILSEPNLIALSGQTASFLAGGEYPIPVPSGLGETSITFKEYGVGLNFTPFVLSPDRISIKVNTEVSELDFTTAVQFGGFVVPGIRTRKAATTIDLADGQSFALAGLLSEDIRENVKKFPFLG
ncbi:MAG TPA: type II and III secretion system protein family protein, partial [Desulfotignum sp.]|nr:type II and III secretion system protein family protein [Desulfotignum sp.]